MHQLHVLVGFRPRLGAAPFHQRQIGRQEGPADILNQGEILRPIARVVIVQKDATHAARTAAMRDKEILIRPCLEARVMRFSVRVQMGFLQIVEMGRILGIFDAGVQVGPATEPPCAGGPEHAGVHMDRRAMGILHMRHKTDAGRPETWIILHPRHAARGHSLLRARAQRAIDSRDIDAHLLEHATAAHHAHQSATRVRSVFGGPFRLRHLEPTCRQAGGGAFGLRILQLLECGHDVIPQLAEPCGGGLLLGLHGRGKSGGLGHYGVLCG